MNTKKLMKDCIFFSVDNLEFFVEDIKEDFLFNDLISYNIDTDNSPVGYVNLFDMEFSYSKSHIRGYEYIIKFTTHIDNEPIVCFSLNKGQLLNFKNTSKSKDRVVFYSSFFTLESLGKLPFSINEFYGICFNHYQRNLARLDIAFDVPYSIKKLQKGIFKGTRFFTQIGEDKKHPEYFQTYYIKNPKGSENRNYVIRIYDKVLDTFKKGKGFLYPHLRNNFDVRRIELELRPKECETYNYSIFDFINNKDDIIYKLFFKYLNKNISEPFENINYKDLNIIKKYHTPFDLRNSFLSIGHIPVDYLIRSSGYIKKIFKSAGYKGLFQFLLGYRKDEEGEPLNFNIGKGYDLLDNLIIYLKEEGLRESVINKILKKHIQKQKIKLNP